MSGRAAGQAGGSHPFPQKAAVGLRGVWMLQGSLKLVCSVEEMEQSHKTAPEDSKLWGQREEATRSLSWARGSAQIHFKGLKDFIPTRKQQRL